MKLKALLPLFIFSLLFIPIANCSFYVECKTQNLIVKEQFTKDSQPVMNRIHKIKACAFFLSAPSNSRKYYSCIRKLRLDSSVYYSGIWKLGLCKRMTLDDFNKALIQLCHDRCLYLNSFHKNSTKNNFLPELETVTVSAPFVSIEMVINGSVIFGLILLTCFGLYIYKNHGKKPKSVILE